MSDFTLEFYTCGVVGCQLCESIGREVRVPHINIKGTNLRTEVLGWLPLPVPNPSDRNLFLSATESKKHIEKNSLSLKDLKCLFLIPDTKHNTDEKKNKDASKKEKNRFSVSKVREIAVCNTCGTKHYVYSNKAIGAKDGPIEKHLEHLEKFLENGYVCGMKIPVKGVFYIKDSMNCGNYIESQYYMPNSGTKGKRIKTNVICAVCYSSDEDFVSRDTVLENCETKGRNILPICKCFDSNFSVPTSGRNVNYFWSGKQSRAKKKTQMAQVVHKGYKAKRN